MSEMENQYQALFQKAKTEDIGMSIDQVAKVVAASTLLGSLAALLITKSKFIIMFLIGSTLIATTAIVVSYTNEPQNEVNQLAGDYTQVEEVDQPILEEETIPVVEELDQAPKEEIRYVSTEEINPVEDDQGSPDTPLMERQTLNQILPAPEGGTGMLLLPQEMTKTDLFHSVEVNMNAEVVLKKSGSCGYELGDEKLKEFLEIDIKDKTLSISVSDEKRKAYHKYVKGGGDVTILVFMPEVKVIVQNGSGEVISEDDIKATELKIVMNGSGDINLKKIAPTKSWKISLAGSGDINLGGTGSCESGKIAVAGSGDVRIADIKTAEVSIAISGSGDVTVNATKSLNANIAGSGDICNRGEGENSLHANGSGTVQTDCK